jgi:preprotein translocase subunit SecE
MKKFFGFIRESFAELTTKVTWPPYNQLQSSSILVLVAAVLFALLVGLIDFAIRNGVTTFYNMF